MSDTPISSSPLLTPRQGFVLTATFVALMVFCIALPRALSFLPGIYGVLVLLYIYCSTHQWPRFDKKLLGIFATITILGALSSLWSVDPHYSFIRALKIAPALFSSAALLAVAGLIPASTANKDRLVAALCLLCGIGGFVLVFEYQTQFAISRYLLKLDDDHLPNYIINGFLLNRTLVYLVLLCLPALLALYKSGLLIRQKIFCLGFMIAGVGLAQLYTQSQTAEFAALLAILMLFYPAHIKWARRLLAVGIIVTIFAAPLIPGPIFKHFFTDTSMNEKGLLEEASIPHRFEVWNFVSSKIQQKPLLGWGLDSTRFIKSDQELQWMKADHVMHPHNAVLECWIEMGVFGAALAAFFVFFLLQKLENLPPLLQRYYTMLLVVTLGVLSMAYGLWQAWQMGMIAAIPALSVMAANMYSLKKRD